MASFLLQPTVLPLRPLPRVCLLRKKVLTTSVRSERRIYKGTYIRERRLAEMIEEKVTEAKRVCVEDKNSDECRVAWDQVEEVSQAKEDLRLKIRYLAQDPLHNFCLQNPENDECCFHED